MLRICGYKASINVRKVLWTCAELDLEYECEDWGGGFRPTSEPGFLALNPVGLVPVIDDGGTIIWESNAIIRYLAASRGRDDLLPVNPAERARIEMWMDWQASDFNNSWRYAFQALVRKNSAYQDAAAIERSIADFNRQVHVVDAELLRSGGFIAGPHFSLADIPIGLSIHRWHSLPATKPSLVHVQRYYDQLCERDAFRHFGRDGGA
jgi:glutathione S-transferase